MINLDPFSIFVTVLYIGILYLFLNQFFFGPILRILHDRRALIAGRLEEAQKRMIQVDKKTAEYEQAIRVARAEGYRKQEVSREEALAARAALVAKAKSDAEASVQAAKSKLQQQAADATKRLESEADKLAENLTVTLLKD
jgi:F-type H+-transporting ATPase subunit b